ncbi:ABC transporter permease [Lentzea sp. NBRC 105346]|uniref:ABC transporter permease n=1 Tax=Lentzea sp. NBRC 105346 TaxID=3032205 RepID=UPI00255311A0|nr:ABC transporter permease [Lentzea sp. NBRC 105346]
MRAALSALGISIGIATMIVVVGIPASSQQQLMNELQALGTNLLRAEVAPGTSGELPPVPENSPEMAKRIGPVRLASAIANAQSTVTRTDRVTDSSGLSVLVAKPDLLEVLNGKVHSGTFLNDANSSFPTVVLGDKAATRLGITEPGPQVWIGKTWFTVVGILDRLPLAPDVERSVLVGWGAAKTHLNFSGHPTVVYVKAEEQAIDDVRGVLPATVFPESPGEIRVSRPSDALAAKRLTENTFSALFLGLAGVALLVGGVGVANTMVISVLERKREIGLRRALGATRGEIRGQFVTESVALCLLGGLSGAALGVLGTAGYAAWRGWPTVIPMTAVFTGIGAALLVGVLAGAYPAVRASRLAPTEALAAP